MLSQQCKVKLSHSRDLTSAPVGRTSRDRRNKHYLERTNLRHQKGALCKQWFLLNTLFYPGLCSTTIVFQPCMCSFNIKPNSLGSIVSSAVMKINLTTHACLKSVFMISQINMETQKEPIKCFLMFVYNNNRTKYFYFQLHEDIGRRGLVFFMGRNVFILRNIYLLFSTTSIKSTWQDCLIQHFYKCYLSCIFTKTIFFRAVLSSQQNWWKNTESSWISPKQCPYIGTASPMINTPQ